MSTTPIFRCFYCLSELKPYWRGTYYHDANVSDYQASLWSPRKKERGSYRQIRASCRFQSQPMYDRGLGVFAYPKATALETKVFWKLIQNNLVVQALVLKLRQIRAFAILETGKDPHA